MADDLMRELAPLLAEDGFDINDVSDIDGLNRALQRAVERRNLALFTPVARIASTPYASAHREVSRIVKMGLVTTEKRGQSVEVKARRDTPVFRPLADLLGLTYGPPVVIPTYLAGIAGIDEAYIYGSWAARRAGEAGDTPGDIDLLIVGNPPRGQVYDAARVAGAALAREVNPRIVSAAAWRAADTDAFLRTLTSGDATACGVMPPY